MFFTRTALVANKNLLALSKPSEFVFSLSGESCQSVSLTWVPNTGPARITCATVVRLKKRARALAGAIAGVVDTMTSLRRFRCDDLFRFNSINLDKLTETYNLNFYLQYLARWPEMCLVAEGPGKSMMGYILGKAEGQGENWHGHVTAVTVAPEYRRQGLARKLMVLLEDVSEKVHNGYFVDLFVRASNALAIGMYKKFGYILYRQVLGYYAGEEDAWDMRKALPRDVEKKSMIPLGRPVRPEECESD